jgi:cation diffusion facilitator CzcD-associated flavoprotein CzcO
LYSGWFGLAAAKTYIELHPHDTMLLLEASSSCGGTWSKDRLYPGLKSNNFRGSYEYPDFPMSQDMYGVEEGQHIPAAVLHRYLTDFAKHFGVFERTQFDARVDVVEANSLGGWDIQVSSTSRSAGQVIKTRKLIVATGLTSQPNIPSYPGQDSFSPLFFHAKDFCANKDTVKTCKSAVVVGAGKSAFDIAYAYATEGSAQVDLVIRPTGAGPVWLSPPYVTPLKRMMEELLNTRLLTWFSPCPWGGDDGFSIPRSFLHGTTIGRFVVRAFWALLSSDVVETHGYNDHTELFKLKPWQSAFWTGSAVGIHNYPTNFFDLVKEGRVKVHIADIAKLDGTSVHLTNLETLETDTVVCATGWKKESPINFINYSPRLSLSQVENERLSDEADKAITTMFPLLKDQPVLRTAPEKSEPLRNYRFIVPADKVFDRNIAFAGMVSTVTTAMFATAQALWISVFFDGKLRRAPQDKEQVLKEVMLHTQFGKWRYPCGYGARLPDFAFDSLPYVDLLLRDVGVEHHRKDTQVAEMFEAYKPRDYVGLANEWADAQKQGECS